MRYLIRLRPRRAGGHEFLDTVRSLARSMMTDARNPKWTSYGALELDVFAKSGMDFELFVAGVEPLADVEFARDLNVAPPHMTKAELVEEARKHFNSERYWEAHEDLEGVWRSLAGEEKKFVQGVILVCAALVHHQKGEEEVALGILRRAVRPLSTRDQESYHGMDVSGLRREAERALTTGRFRHFEV